MNKKESSCRAHSYNIEYERTFALARKAGRWRNSHDDTSFEHARRASLILAGLGVIFAAFFVLGDSA